MSVERKIDGFPQFMLTDVLLLTPSDGIWNRMAKGVGSGGIFAVDFGRGGGDGSAGVGQKTAAALHHASVAYRFLGVTYSWEELPKPASLRFFYKKLKIF